MRKMHTTNYKENTGSSLKEINQLETPFNKQNSLQ